MLAPLCHHSLSLTGTTIVTHGLRTWCTGHTQACRALAQAQQHQRLLLAWLLIQWAGCSACAQVHHRLQAAGSQAHRLQQSTMIEGTGRLPSAQGPSAPSPALLSLIVRKNGQTPLVEIIKIKQAQLWGAPAALSLHRLPPFLKFWCLHNIP